MLDFLPAPLKGGLSFIVILLNTIVLCVPLLLSSLLKFVIPIKGFIVVIDKCLIGIATLWISINRLNFSFFNKIHWDVRGLETLSRREWYLVVSNHQSWVDILVLQNIFNRKIPMLKFFLKKELIWVPFLGLAWWALDFPFMKRYSKAFLEANPHLASKDLESTKAACEKFKHTPISVMNFVEGTRFTPEKHKRNASPYTHLLPPKAGGIGFVLGAMGEYLQKLINVTIVYPGHRPSFWEFLSGRVKNVMVDIEVIPISHIPIDSNLNDDNSKSHLYSWLNELWRAKDIKINQLMGNEMADKPR
ncbi:MAG: acyltransferase [Desulfobacterales bacterium]|nr:MAG: acyltransferase [Desulfobacterales bacterium]